MARRAYGAHRTMNAHIKARNVGESILAHALPLNDATWQRYGLDGDDKAQQRRLVLEWLILSSTKRPS